MKLFVRSAILLTAAALVPLMPTAAHADRYTHIDAIGDVLSGPATSTSNPSTPESERANGDITASKVIHKARKVIMRMKYRDIAWNDEVNAHLFVVRTSKMKRYVQLVAGDGFRGGKVVVTKPNGKRVKCRVKRNVDYTVNTATVKVPRSCLGYPRWVKVGMASVFYTGFKAADTLYVDDARTNGTLGSGPALSPKVRR
jgi:hypothetical protein